MKTFILVIIASILIGVLIFLLSQIFFKKTSFVAGGSESASPTISVAPTFSPTSIPVTINQGSDLKAEINKLTPADFSKDYQNLKNEAANF